MYLFVCALCMFINGVLAAGAKLKSIRYNTQYTVFENKLFIVIFCIGVFFGIGAYGVDKMELVAIIITAIVAFVVGLWFYIILASIEQNNLIVWLY